MRRHLPAFFVSVRTQLFFYCETLCVASMARLAHRIEMLQTTKIYSFLQSKLQFLHSLLGIYGTPSTSNRDASKPQKFYSFCNRKLSIFTFHTPRMFFLAPTTHAFQARTEIGHLHSQTTKQAFLKTMFTQVSSWSRLLCKNRGALGVYILGSLGSRCLEHRGMDDPFG